MFNSFYFFLFSAFFTFLLMFRYLNSLLNLFFFTELLWIFLFCFSAFGGMIFDDIALYGLLVSILFITAFEAGLLIIIYKFFPVNTIKLTSTT